MSEELARQDHDDPGYWENLSDEASDQWEVERGMHPGWLGVVAGAISLADMVWSHWRQIHDWFVFH
jgi:hypothetical protein